MNKKPAKGAYLDILLRSQSSNMGIDNMEGYSIAAPKRAFLDVLYVHKQYHFEGMGGRDMLSGLGELVDTEKEKGWVRTTLRTEVLFFLKLAHDNETSS